MLVISILLALLSASYDLSQHSIVQLLLWNEINSDANIAANVNGQQNLTGFVEFFILTSIWWVADDVLVISVLEKSFELRLKNLIPWKIINLQYIIYCTNCIHSLLQHLHS